MFSTLTEQGAAATLDALAAGASDYVTKPSSMGSIVESRESVRAQLIPKIKALTGRATHRITPATPQASAALRDLKASARTRPLEAPKVLAVGCSTGGPEALVTVLRALPQTFPLPDPGGAAHAAGVHASFRRATGPGMRATGCGGDRGLPCSPWHRPRRSRQFPPRGCRGSAGRHCHQVAADPPGIIAVRPSTSSSAPWPIPTKAGYSRWCSPVWEATAASAPRRSVKRMVRFSCRTRERRWSALGNAGGDRRPRTGRRDSAARLHRERTADPRESPWTTGIFC